MTKSLRPFLKWAGNKYQLLKHIKPFLPANKRLIEPFCGSAAVCLATDYEHYLLGETNPDLILLYEELKKGGVDFIAYTQNFFQSKYNQQKYYYQFREKFNSTDDKTLKAALFIYLNRHGYNGLCRYNQARQFNVPFGRFEQIYFPKEPLQQFHLKSKKIDFVCQDFRLTLKNLRKTDVVYCDPPYVPWSNTASFTHYNGQTFTQADQIALAKLAERLQERGIRILISNHDTPFTREIYHRATLYFFEVRRYISRNTHNREIVRELLAVYE